VFLKTTKHVRTVERLIHTKIQILLSFTQPHVEVILGPPLKQTQNTFW